MNIVAKINSFNRETSQWTKKKINSKIFCSSPPSLSQRHHFELRRYETHYEGKFPEHEFLPWQVAENALKGKRGNFSPLN